MLAVPTTDDEKAKLRSALRFDLLLMLLFTVIALGGTAYGLVHEERAALDDPLQQGARGEVVGADGASLLRQPNLARAIAVLNGALKSDEQLTNFRLDPTTLTVLARDTIGHQSSISVTLDYKSHRSQAGSSSSHGPPKAIVDAAAPGRMLATIQSRERYPPKSFNYLVYDISASDEPHWSAFYEDVPIERNHFVADRHGNYAGVPGEPNAGGPQP